VTEDADVSYDVAALRTRFPSLASGIAHFDGPGGTQVPREVADAVASTMAASISNRGAGLAGSERRADEVVADFRAAYADLLGADPRDIVHGRSATPLTYDVARALARTWEPGDEVVVSRLDHDANVRPWIQVAEARGATVRWLEIDPRSAELDERSIDEAITDRTRLVAVTGASNLLGTMPDVRRVADAAHAVGALVHVDAVHLAAHHRVGLERLGVDLLVCSPYKFLGPHCGVLAASPGLLEDLRPDKLLPSTDVVPERFELGTLPYEQLAGATAAVDVLAGLAPGGATTRPAMLDASFAALDAHETRLRQRLEDGIAALGEDRVVLHSRARHRTPTLFLTFPGRRSRAAYEFLAGRDVLAPAGSFYAIEPWQRLRDELGLEDEGGLRLGLAPYVDDEDVDRVLAGLGEWLAVS
jgi:cysteine desulfurase family protein (TIGR01976 family)